MPSYWLFKSEPDVYGIQHLASEPGQRVRWDGIRNYQARNFIRDGVTPGDLVLFYHSSCRPTGVAGVCEVLTSAYADPTQFDPRSPYFDSKATADKPRWYAVDICLKQQFTRIVTTDSLRAQPQLEEMVLFSNPRLSVQPVTAEEWQVIMDIAKT